MRNAMVYKIFGNFQIQVIISPVTYDSRLIK